MQIYEMQKRRIEPNRIYCMIINDKNQCFEILYTTSNCNIDIYFNIRFIDMVSKMISDFQ